MTEDFDKNNLLTFKDLPFSRTTAWRLMRQGRLRCYRINRRVFFDARHVEELLQNCETKVLPEKTIIKKNSWIYKSVFAERWTCRLRIKTRRRQKRSFGFCAKEIANCVLTKVKKNMRPRIIQTANCRRCGKNILTLDRSLTGADDVKAKYDRICSACITPEEEVEIIEALAASLLKNFRAF